jgi:hypothetical protein
LVDMARLDVSEVFWTEEPTDFLEVGRNISIRVGNERAGSDIVNSRRDTIARASLTDMLRIFGGIMLPTFGK